MTLPVRGSFVLHVPCGVVRGEHRLFTQGCPCAPTPSRPGVFGRLVDLCAVCGHGLSYSGSPFTSLACRSCRTVEAGLREAFGLPVLPLSRVGISNGFRELDGSRLPYRPLTRDLRTVAVDLPAHGRRVVQQLARGLEEEELPVELWQVLHPESAERSVAAYEELLGGPLPGQVTAEVRRQSEASRPA